MAPGWQSIALHVAAHMCSYVLYILTGLLGLYWNENIVNFQEINFEHKIPSTHNDNADAPNHSSLSPSSSLSCPPAMAINCGSARLSAICLPGHGCGERHVLHRPSARVREHVLHAYLPRKIANYFGSTTSQLITLCASLSLSFDLLMSVFAVTP